MISDRRIALGSINENRLNIKNYIPLKKTNIGSKDLFNEHNDSIDIYANKLKFKLKLALCELNQHQNPKPSAIKSFSINSPTSSSTKIMRRKLSPLKKNNIRNKLNSKKLFSSSANINLTKKTPLQSTRNTNNINNTNNTNNTNSNLKLFSIKKNSPFYNSVSNVPLVDRSINGRNGNNATRFNSETLPPINKILQTPLKLTNSEKNIDKSPINLTTPNSFSVAKSLLQLGSGYYN